MTGGTFPGAVSVSHLDVYDDAAPDGVVGGSPHVHLASTEAYVVLAGSGTVQTLTVEGYRELPLAPGVIVWFTPGTIHRAVNHGGLRILVVMQNSGLPEAGDAVMTFPSDRLVDLQTYRSIAVLPSRSSDLEREQDAARRRDLAVEGFILLCDAARAGDIGPLREFFASSARLVRSLAPTWAPIVREGALSQAHVTLETIGDLVDGSSTHLEGAAVSVAESTFRFGMCGRLRAFELD